MSVPRTGRYRFELASDDRSHLLIDGETVLRHAGQGSADVDLDEGDHRFRLRFEQTGGPTLIEGTEQHEYYYRNDMHFNPKGFEAWSRLHIEAITDPENKLLPESILESSAR